MAETSAKFAFALMLPVYHLFDYVVDDARGCAPGQRYRVPFGRGEKVALSVSAVSGDGHGAGRLKAVRQCLDDAPILSLHLLELAHWVADYYCQPIGEVLFLALPRYCREPRRLQPTRLDIWRADAVDSTQLAELESRAPVQFLILQALMESESGLDAAALKCVHDSWREPLRALQRKGLVSQESRENLPGPCGQRQSAPRLTVEQQAIVAELSQQLERFRVHLLQGVTGSGKTEVYLALMQQIIGAGGQVIYLVPEIGLTPQLLQRLRDRLGPTVVSAHSAQSDYQRYQGWDQFRRGAARVMIGTRSALFSEGPDLGLIIIDEEHDLSYRQQDGVRYHARDVAIKRAQMLGIPIILGSATPSLETLHNLTKPHFRRYRLDRRPDGAQAPVIRLIDCRNATLQAGCSPPLLDAMDRHLRDGGQVLLFLNRRGYAPVVMCFECGWQATCHQCDARLTLHQSVNRLICHHCGYHQPAPAECPACHAPGVRHFGVGTQQLEAYLQDRFSGYDVIRIDRDTVKSSSTMEQHLRPVRAGRPCILVGTQMLAKGHDYPHISLVGIIDADQALHSSFYRASERLVQTVLQVSGRAGRAERRGVALLQTAFADHPLMRDLCQRDYDALVQPMLDERRALGFPPFSRVVSFVVDAVTLELALQRLEEVNTQIEAIAAPGELRVIGPIPALMARRIGRYRAQLSVMSAEMEPLRRLLRQLLPVIGTQRGGQKWNLVIEVDPPDL